MQQSDELSVQCHAIVPFAEQHFGTVCPALSRTAFLVPCYDPLYVANITAEEIYNQINDEGHENSLFSGMFSHEFDETIFMKEIHW